MDLTGLRSTEKTSTQTRMRPKERRWPRLAVLAGIFFVLLYLYLNLSEPPMPASGVDAKGVRSVFSIYGWGNERLNSPSGVAADKAGNIYLADTANHRVAVFDRRGNFRFSFGRKAKNPAEQLKVGPMVFPTGLAVADNGDIYVACMSRNQILIFNRNGEFRREIMTDRPITVAIAGNRLYVTSPGAVMVYSLRGDLVNHFGSQGRSVREFEYPNGLALDKKGNIFVSDTQNSRIQIFNPGGELIGVKGRPPRNLNDPQRVFGLNMGMTMDERERVYVVDAFRHSIHAFDHEGNELGEFGEKGELDGRFNYPSGIAYLGSGLFAVADKWNDRVQVVRLALPTPPGQIADQAQSWLPYILLALLILFLIFLSWRRRRSLRSEEILQVGLGNTFHR